MRNIKSSSCRHSRALKTLQLVLLVLVWLPRPAVSSSFVNWESPHVHPLDTTPDGTRLLAANTADNRLTVFDLSGSLPVIAAEVAVGLDPVSVRARSNDEVWVVNHISDSISVVDLTTLNVRATLSTLDEPTDVVFAGTPTRAFVSCSQANALMVFDPEDLDAPPAIVELQGEEPRALAVSGDGQKVFVAFFDSGNGTTSIPGRLVFANDEINAVNHPDGPYGGQNPPPNDGDGFVPAIRPEYLPGGSDPAPAAAMIVQRVADQPEDRWVDDNGGDWTRLVSGDLASFASRPEGWQLLDHDVAVLDTATMEVEWIAGLMNLNMAMAVHPTSGAVTVVGTDATNHIRFEPNLKARFLRVQLAIVDPAGGAAPTVTDLNGGHLDYSDAQVALQADPATADQALRDLSIGDPRAIVWSSDGTTGYLAGMGSNNVVRVDGTGVRRAHGEGTVSPIEVGEGPTGLVLDETRGRLYVLNKFDSSLSVVDLESAAEVTRIDVHDPSPEAIRAGRRFLYDTHATSGLGHVACASCHIDGRMDRLAWDLGDPSGDIEQINSFPGQHNLGMDIPGINTGFLDFHPMKGPMVTQTLQDIIGKEPLHWRGDRDGLEQFNGAFEGLQGDDRQLTPEEMQHFEDFLATLHLPPNPLRNPDNSLPTDLPLPDQFSNGQFAAQGGLEAGEPMPNGNAVRGLEIFRPPNVTTFGGLACSSCHTLPTGAGADMELNAGMTEFVPIAPGPNGERHLSLFIMDGTTDSTIKIPQLRNMYEKRGFDTTGPESVVGFGYEHDGSMDTLTGFHMRPAFFLDDDQQVADLVAFMLAFSGSDLPAGSTEFSFFDLFEPPGVASQDAHASVGRQLTITAENRNEASTIQEIGELTLLADTGAVGLVAKAVRQGETRGYVYLGGGGMQSDRLVETTTVDILRQETAVGEELTLTVVPTGTETRIGIDRDEDGFFDRDELDACSDPADATSTPLEAVCTLFADGFESGDVGAWSSTSD